MPGAAQVRPGRGAGRPKRGLRRSLTTAFAADIAAETEALAGAGASDGIDFETLETAVRRRALGLAARLVERRLNADRGDRSAPWLPCGDCRGRARYAGRRAKTVTSVLGALRLERAYYHCPACNAGFHPRDRTLGIEGGSLSPGVVRMTGLAAARASFAETGALLHDLAGVNVDAKQAERTAEALGRDIAVDERDVVEPEPGRAPTMYLGMDGTGVPVRRAELAGRAGKQADGSARTREVKLVAVWAAATDADGRELAEREAGSVSYSAAVESAATRDADAELSPFARRVEREARRRGFDRAPRRVVLGDGAPWIWNIADELFPGAVQIVDLFHAKQHLWDVAKAVYGPGTDMAERWAKRRRDELDHDRIGALLRALRRHAGRDEARRCIDYIRRNRHRMRYPAFRASNLCVGSGVLEAGCKNVVGTRFKRPGMHWSVPGVDAMAALRCCVLSNRLDDFWIRRKARAKARAAA